MPTHYHKKRSLLKRVRQFGFRKRMSTSLGRKMLSRKRRTGRRLAVRRKF